MRIDGLRNFLSTFRPMVIKRIRNVANERHQKKASKGVDVRVASPGDSSKNCKRMRAYCTVIRFVRAYANNNQNHLPEESAMYSTQTWKLPTKKL